MIDIIAGKSSPNLRACHISIYSRLFKMIQSSRFLFAISSPQATALHLAGNPYPSSELLDQAVESGSKVLEPLKFSSLYWASSTHRVEERAWSKYIDVGNCRNTLYPFPTTYQLCSSFRPYPITLVIKCDSR